MKRSDATCGPGSTQLGPARKMGIELDRLPGAPLSDDVFGFEKSPPLGNLDNATFTTAASNNYEIVGAIYNLNQGGSHLIKLDTSMLPADQRNLVLHVCDQAYAFNAATISPRQYIWSGSNQDWSLHAERTLYLSQDTTAPTFVSATVDGTTLVVTLSEDLGAAASLAYGDFAVKKNGSTTSLSSTDPVISGNTVTLTLATAVTATDTNVLVSYTKPTSGTDNKLVDAFGNETATFTDQPVFRVLVSNAGQGEDANTPITRDHSQAFTAGGTGKTYTVHGVTMTSEDTEGDDLALQICDADSNGNPTTTCTDLTAPDSFAAGPLFFTAPTSPALELSSAANYAVVFKTPGGETVVLDSTGSNNEDASSPSGWSIRDRSKWKSGATSWLDQGDEEAVRITIHGREVTINNAPTVANPIPNQTATAGTPFSYTFPADTFNDTDTLTYTATKADNAVLPTWLTFTAATRTFSGTPTAAETVSVKVTATDNTDSVSDEFDITVNATLVLRDWSLKPTGLTAGDQFRLIFLSSTKRDGTATAIADYNTFVQTRAAAGHTGIQSYSAGFKVVGCTAGVDARDNTSTTGTGVPIYWLDGNKVADTYADFYDVTWDDEANDKNESGTDAQNTSQAANYPLTGCLHNGTEAIAGINSRALGMSTIRVGRPNSSTAGHGPLSGPTNATSTDTRPMYGLSVFEVAAPRTGLTVTQQEDWSYTFRTPDFNNLPGRTGRTTSVKITALPGKGSLTLENVPITSRDLPKTLDATHNYLIRLRYRPPADGNGIPFTSFKFNVNESATEYTMTINITPVNDPPYGRVFITGPAQVGYDLTALTASIGDQDGIPSTLNYQWKRYAADGITFEQNIGANSNTYRLTGNEQNKKIKLEVSYIDDEGTREVILSPAFPYIATQMVGEATFISTIGMAGDASHYFTTQDQGQVFTTGRNPNGYTVTSVVIISQDTQGDDVALKICEVDSSLHPTTVCTDLTPPGMFPAGPLVFTAPPGTTLEGDRTNYMVVFNSPGGTPGRLQSQGVRP